MELVGKIAPQPILTASYPRNLLQHIAFRLVDPNAYAGLGMTPAEAAALYRVYASDCVTLAQRIANSESKLRLLDMGRAWLDLADQAERNAQMIVVYETPDQSKPEP